MDGRDGPPGLAQARGWQGQGQPEPALGHRRRLPARSRSPTTTSWRSTTCGGHASPSIQAVRTIREPVEPLRRAATDATCHSRTPRATSTTCKSLPRPSSTTSCSLGLSSSRSRVCATVLCQLHSGQGHGRAERDGSDANSAQQAARSARCRRGATGQEPHDRRVRPGPTAAAAHAQGPERQRRPSKPVNPTPSCPTSASASLRLRGRVALPSAVPHSSTNPTRSTSRTLPPRSSAAPATPRATSARPSPRCSSRLHLRP